VPIVLKKKRYSELIRMRRNSETAGGDISSDGLEVWQRKFRRFRELGSRLWGEFESDEFGGLK